jgi:hypothetical protein
MLWMNPLNLQPGSWIQLDSMISFIIFFNLNIKQQNFKKIKNKKGAKHIRP